MSTTRPIGIVEGMPFEQYLAVDALSASGLKLLARSPWHYKHRVETQQTRPMLRGSLAHCALLEPAALEQRYVVAPQDAPRRPTKAQLQAKKPSPDSAAAMAWWAQFEASLAGRKMVTADEFAVCQSQLEAVVAQPELAAILRAGRAEVSIFWIDERTGIYCKARPDFLPAPDGRTVTPLDLKTCADESPSGFGRAAARLRYDLQAAHYTAGIEAATGLQVRQFVFGAVSNKPPVLAVPYALTDEVRDQGRDERLELMDRLAWCQRENEWPAYGSGIQLLDFPAYANASGEVEIEWSDEQ